MNNDLIHSSIWGVLRGLSVHTLIYPLEVIKIRQQCSSHSENCARIALNILKQEGFGVFYRGLSPQLVKTSLKQVWCWQMIMGLPKLFQPLGELPAQALTGLSIATIDATITTPLERMKILSAYKGKTVFSFKNGWHGFATHYRKLSVNWMTFLTAQHYFRSQYPPSEPLSILQLTKIGIQVAAVGSLIGAPFDVAHTLKQINAHKVINYYRGWSINAVSLIIHNIASVTLIDKLNKI